MCWSKQLFMFSGHFGSMCVCITFVYICVTYVYAYVLHIFNSIYNVQRKSSILHLSGGHINVDFMFALFGQV